MNEDPHLDDDIAAWLNTPVEGPDIPQGATNGSLIANDPAWAQAVEDGEIDAYLSTRAGFGDLWNRIVARAREAIACALFVDWVSTWWFNHQGSGG